MKKYLKPIMLFIFTAVLIIAAPYINKPGTCSIYVPFIFTSEISDRCCGNNISDQANINEKFAAFADEKISLSDEKINQQTITLIEFEGENCIPCRNMKPVIEQVLKKYKDQVKIISYDIMSQQGRVQTNKFAIRVIPTQIFLDKNGKEYFRHEGFFSFEDIDKIIEQQITK